MFSRFFFISHQLVLISANVIVLNRCRVFINDFQTSKWVDAQDDPVCLRKQRQSTCTVPICMEEFLSTFYDTVVVRFDSWFENMFLFKQTFNKLLQRFLSLPIQVNMSWTCKAGNSCLWVLRIWPPSELTCYNETLEKATCSWFPVWIRLFKSCNHKYKSSTIRSQ